MPRCVFCLIIVVLFSVGLVTVDAATLSSNSSYVIVANAEILLAYDSEWPFDFVGYLTSDLTGYPDLAINNIFAMTVDPYTRTLYALAWVSNPQKRQFDNGLYIVKGHNGLHEIVTFIDANVNVVQGGSAFSYTENFLLVCADTLPRVLRVNVTGNSTAQVWSSDAKLKNITSLVLFESFAQGLTHVVYARNGMAYRQNFTLSSQNPGAVVANAAGDDVEYGLQIAYDAVHDVYITASPPAASESTYKFAYYHVPEPSGPGEIASSDPLYSILAYPSTITGSNDCRLWYQDDEQAMFAGSFTPDSVMHLFNQSYPSEIDNAVLAMVYVGPLQLFPIQIPVDQAGTPTFGSTPEFSLQS